MYVRECIEYVRVCACVCMRVMFMYEFVSRVFSYRTPASFAACSDVQVVGTNHVLAERERDSFRQKS